MFFLFKRTVLIAIILLINACATRPANNIINDKSNLIEEKFAKIESDFNVRIVLYAINTNNNQIIAYRPNEEFPLQSTMKMIGVGALLKQSENKNENFLQKKIYFTKEDLTEWSPVTKLHLKDGMTLKDLGEAAITYSDNTAMNVIMKKFGGPKFSTDFAHSISNNSYNVTNYDGFMNSDPKIIDDTSTPQDMAISVQKLMLGNVLTKSHQQLLIMWMRNSVTGYKTIRAGVPMGFAVADKTGGSGAYGVRNDIGIVWSPSCKPIILAIYTVNNVKEAKSRDDIIAMTTNILLEEFAKRDICFK